MGTEKVGQSNSVEYSTPLAIVEPLINEFRITSDDWLNCILNINKISNIYEHISNLIMKHKIQFADGAEIQVDEMDGEIFNSLQEKYKNAIVMIDGQLPVFWGMTDDEIEKELKRIGMKKNYRDDAVREYQTNCKHNRGYTTNTGTSPSKCIVCGKSMF